MRKFASLFIATVLLLGLAGQAPAATCGDEVVDREADADPRETRPKRRVRLDRMEQDLPTQCSYEVSRRTDEH